MVKKFLICDDSILARKQLKDVVLELFPDALIIEAPNGDDAVSLYKDHKPNLVFLDIVMPVKDGTTAIREICEFDSEAQIIVVSSVGTQSQLKAAIEAGAKDFLQKPVDNQTVKDIITRRVGGQ